MFEKLFMLVKDNAGRAVLNNPIIAEKYRDAVMIEASSSIIDGLKKQMETGKLNDVVQFFKHSGQYSAALITNIANRFADKLNDFYGVTPEEARDVSNMLIPEVMNNILARSKNVQDTDFAPGYMLSSINGNDVSPLVNRMMVA
ncbi:hypothetical protein [Mucilaginibacter myungsuensis]|uniref:Uncharacterized protein n=1 Tax=Mucilaginibacter myungsuensis TaxID=649104 RepID=A0A929PWF3_9SPHI|nr:hypothetical protein [Mucilaginibacter myungsuensis]MBE9662778.1 hypothetical protein [Mucilaginibacter myungsuensis]MDN3598198.1 hypothetical protein [Mucilaginibacter myungsuensis]